MQLLKPSKFLIQVAIALSFLSTCNIVVGYLSRNAVPRQILRDAQSSENATDLFVGNSLMAAGFEPKVFESNLSNRKAINLGLGSSSPVEHYLLLKSSSNHPKSTIYYGFFDTQLTDSIKSDYESLFGNRAASYYIEPEIAISLYAPDDFVKAWQLRLIGKVPMLVERASIWANVERMRRNLGEIGMPKVAVNKFGRNEDFQALAPSNENSFAQACRNAVQSEARFNVGITAIFQLANQRNVKTILILMPMTQKHRDKFYSTSSWKSYQNYLNNLIQSTGGIFIDASDWIADDKFSDGLHLNNLGAEEFSQKIAVTQKPLQVIDATDKI